jgi:hypothetical protein
VDVSPVDQALEWLRFASGVLLFIVAYLLKERFTALGNVEKKVNRIDKILYAMVHKDRMHRLEDYENNVTDEDEEHE